MQIMSQDYEQLIALAPWAVFLLAVLVFWVLGLRDRMRAAAPRRAASSAPRPRSAEAPLR